MKFAEQFNYGFISVNSNPEFQNEEERILKTYEVKSEDGQFFKYDIYFINEPTKRTVR